MADPPPSPKTPAELYCPDCAEPARDSLVYGDCLTVICRRCGIG